MPLLALLALAGCSAPEGAVLPATAPDGESAKVLVVINSDSVESQQIGSYYLKKRAIPNKNVAWVSCPETDEISMTAYKDKIETPVRAAISKLGGKIDYIVLTRGTPIRISTGGYSVDGQLVAMDTQIPAIQNVENEDQIKRSMNPYAGQSVPFSHAKFGIYLVCRLTGYSVDGAKRLVDNSLAAKPEKGPFFFDEADNRKSDGYGQLQALMDVGGDGLSKSGFQVQIDKTGPFIAPPEPLAGYCSWGSNDGAYDRGTYMKLKFKPGALAETFVSTSGRTFDRKTLQTDGGQSNIADLIEQGVTGIKGYVSEPYTFALARPDILWARYTSGMNLAESFYSASLVVRWKDLVIGDPLCRPYKK